MGVSMSTLRLAGFCGLLVCLVACAGQGQAADTVMLTTPSSSASLSGDYPLTNLRISLRVKYSKPGTVLDTVGINAAPAGSFALAIGADGKPVFLVYEPGKESSVRVSNGWHVIPSDTAILANTDANIDIDVLEKQIVLSVNGKVEKEVDVAVKLSGKTVYIGDNPDDDTWGGSYNIHPAMIGEVQALYFGDVSKAPARSDEKGQVVELTSPSSSAKLQGGYPVTNLRIALTVKYSKSGVVLDTVGINEAPEGSFTLNINSAGKPVFAVFSPDTESAVKLDNGWHVISADAAIPPDTEGEVDVDVHEKDLVMRVNGKMEKRVTLAVKLSGKTVYVGDNPDDDSWGDSYNIHPAMVGTVKVRFFGEIKDAPQPQVAPAATEKGPLTDPPAAIDAGVKNVEDAFRAGQIEDVLKLTCPAFISRYKPVFEAHKDQLPRLAEILATRKLVTAVGARAEYEVTSNDRTLTVVFEKVDGVWMLSAL